MGEAIVQGAAIVGGVAVLGAGLWRWIVGPAFAKQVTVVVRQEVAPIKAELSMNGSRSVKDVVNRIDARLEDHIRLHEQNT